MMKSVAILGVFLTVLLVESDTQHVNGNCAVGRYCDHCPFSRVKWMRNPMAGYYHDFKVCCSNCNRHFFNFNVLWQSFCTCMNIPENVRSNVITSNSIITSNGDFTSSQDTTPSGNCWSGSNCTNCNSISYINNVQFCCPHCSGYGISVSSVNNHHTCTCHQPRQRKITGNCLFNDDCNGCQNASYMNNMRVCCPNCTGINTLMSNGYSTHCQCY